MDGIPHKSIFIMLTDFYYANNPASVGTRHSMDLFIKQTDNKYSDYMNLIIVYTMHWGFILFLS